MTLKALFASAAALAFTGGIAITMPAAAQPDHCPPGHAKKGWCDTDYGYYTDRDAWDRDRERLRRAYEEGYRDARQDYEREAWAVGQSYEDDPYYDDYRVIRDYTRYGLQQPPSGFYYAETRSNILLVDSRTGIVAAVVNGY